MPRHAHAQQESAVLTPLQYNLQGGLGHTATAAELKWRCFERISTLVAETPARGGSVAELSCQVGLLLFNLSPKPAAAAAVEPTSGAVAAAAGLPQQCGSNMCLGSLLCKWCRNQVSPGWRP